jgi:DNA-directed RNA polymerase beta' subunit
VKDWAIRSVTSYGRCVFDVKVDYGRHSEAERVLVNNEGLAIQSLLKIQSGPLGNLGEPPFDGDEMNMHLPQNILAETELRHLAAIPYQMISPSGNAPVIGIYQDSLLGSFRFTRPNIKLTPREVMNLLMLYTDVDVNAILENKEQLTSFDVLSQILGPLTMKYKTKLFDESEDMGTSNNVLEIRSGKYIRGQIEKSVLGASTKGIVHRMFNDFGPMAAANFIDDLQNIINEYMKSSSFSVGVSDLIANKKTQDQIIKIISDQKMEVQSELEKLHLGIFENDTSNTNMVQFETNINNILNKATEQAGKEGRKSLSKDNRFLMIVNSGSKGNLVNISQMISCVGQTNVDGKRISYGFNDRTLPHYKKFDDSPAARGFIENSYISGLTAPELFFHAMGGRIGLIDTAVKTSTTGYIQRRLIKGLEDLKVEYDMTVRNNRGKIIQFKYGDDGFDSTKAENQAIPLVGMSVEDVFLHYEIAGIYNEKNDMLRVYTKGTVTRMKKQHAEIMKKTKSYIDKMLDVRELIVKNIFKYKNENTVKVPVAFQNIIANVQGQLGLNSHSITDITPLEAFELIEDTFETIKQLLFAPPTPLFEILYYYYLSPRDLLVNKRFHRKGLQLLLETIVLKYKQALVHPGEMVGVIAGQSIGEPTTQLTLNSVTYETEIVVRNQKKEIKKVQIGDFVKEHIEKSKQIQYMEDKDTTYAELSQEDEYYEVPSANEEGHTLWTRIEAVTKHPVINEDGSNTMLKLTTKGCREVIVTRAKSCLQLIDGKIQGIDSKDLKVGDYLPVSKKPLEYQPTDELDLRTILPQNEYLYGNDYKKAKEVMNQHEWWSKHSGKTFILPHARSDSFVDLTKANKNIHENCVYMKMTNNCEYKVPDKIPLDYDFGYLIGAYCAEGCMTKHQISIANNDLEYLTPIERLCEKWNITTKIYKTANKIQEGWTSQDIRIYNTVLCRILDSLCGKLSHNKFVSDKIVFSNPQCIMGFLDAYIGGDGCVKKCSQSERIENICACSVSKTMLTDIMVMLKNMGIVANMNKPRKIESNNRGSKNIKQTYMLTIRNKQAHKLAHMLHLPIHSKHGRIDKLMDQSFLYEYDKAYLTVPNKINGETVMEPRNDRMPDILFDEIVSIEEVPNTTPYAYDLTVEITRNFDCYNGLCENDTFHMAGVAAKSNVTRGVPRIEEILRLTDNPKNPSLTIHLKPVDELDKDRATVYANMLEHTRLVDVVKSIQICFDPLERSSFMEEDKAIIDQFYEFEDMLRECMEDETNPTQKSKWIIRMELDAETLLDKNITMDDVHFAIKNVNPDIHCVYSDYNESNLVFRIRMNSDSLKKKKGAAYTLDQSDEIYLLKTFQDNLLYNIVLRGVHGIDNVLPRKIQNMVVKEEGKYVRKDIWILDTTGTNLLDVLGTDFIDESRTYGNDIQEIFNVLGIEAARQVIFNEFVEVMEFSDVYINYHHLSLLCDRMTVTQNMVAIFRSGLHNDNIGPIAKATFEVHTEILLNAARHADFDEMRGVSANVMCGQHGYYGTGAFNVILDMKEISKLADADVIIKDNDKEIERIFGKLEDTAEVCARNSILIRNNISAIHQSASEICQDNYDMGF